MNKLFFKIFILVLLLSHPAFSKSNSPLLPDIPSGIKKIDLGDTAKINALLRLASTYVNKPGEQADDLSNAINYGNQALSLSHQYHFLPQEIAAYSLLSQSYREKKDIVAGRKYAEQGVKLLPKNSTTIEAADVLAELSTYYDATNADSLIIKINYFTKSVGILRKVAPRTKKLADGLKFLGDLKNSRYDLKEAVSLLNESLALYQLLGVKQLQDIYDLLGDALTSSGNTVEGLSYQLKALKTAEMFKDTSQMISTIYYRLAFTYNSINQDNRTAEYMDKASYYALKNRNNNDWIMISGSLGTIYNKLGRYREAVKTCEEALIKCPTTDYQNQTNLITNLLFAATATKKLDKASGYYNRLKQLTDAHNIELSPTDAAMIEYLIAMKQFPEAELQVEKFIKYAAVTQSLISKQKIEHYQFQVDSARGNFLSAISHQENAHLLRDSMLSRNYNKQIGRMQMTFDLQKKDQEIAFKAKHIDLLTHQNQLQNSALHSQKMIRNLFIASVLLLMALLAVLYNRYKLKHQANNDLQEQQEEINTQNEYLRQLVDEREWLLKEVHHRVKNNLQIVISLLNSQLSNIKDVVAIDVIRDSQNRMRSISLIHQKLYQFDNLATIDAGDYIREIALYLQDSFDTFGHIKLRVDVAPVRLDVSQAVPIGLILNEAITNSIKYAFADQTDKQVSINLTSTDNHVRLMISDNGKGLSPEIDIKQSKSLGMQLMTGLSRQIRAQLKITSNNGLTIELEWQQADPFHTSTHRGV
ncbi:sensor histidine kinase [Mucilaginibacter gossypii]|uniref:histidine kinase n=2 Tax=Mucilaginibacter TaxID=423349 RepID=A0A1G8N6L8_9SPHI|nr:sensor histidine kinase [Mucilaginibacter gossypii]SDI75842.1 Two-component sensor histidine kinase, contains HisKA and HATPase domains [Mucilaginibacter gossypii]